MISWKRRMALNAQARRSKEEEEKEDPRIMGREKGSDIWRGNEATKSMSSMGKF